MPDSARAALPEAPANSRQDTALLRSAASWRILDDRVYRSGCQNVGYDRVLAASFRQGDSRPVCRIWQNQQSLVVARKDTQLPRFEHASTCLAEQGWPLLLRDTGGTAVPHTAGVIQLSMILPYALACPYSLDDIYLFLAEPLRNCLRALAIDAQYGLVPGAFCDGRYNLQVNGRKIAGTAQLWRAHAGAGFVLAQASLFVSLEMASATAAVNSFYRLAGDGRRFDPTSITSVALCENSAASTVRNIPSQALVEQVRCQLLGELRDYFGRK